MQKFLDKYSKYVNKIKLESIKGFKTILEVVYQNFNWVSTYQIPLTLQYKYDKT